MWAYKLPGRGRVWANSILERKRQPLLHWSSHPYPNPPFGNTHRILPYSPLPFWELKSERIHCNSQITRSKWTETSHQAADIEENTTPRCTEQRKNSMRGFGRSDWWRNGRRKWEMGFFPQIEIFVGFCLSDQEKPTLEIGARRSALFGRFGIWSVFKALSLSLSFCTLSIEETRTVNGGSTFFERMTNISLFRCMLWAAHFNGPLGPNGPLWTMV